MAPEPPLMVLILSIFSLFSPLTMSFMSPSLFNLLSLNCLTHSLDCLVSFLKYFVFLQDQSWGRMIGIRYESPGPYQLQTSAHAGSMMDSPSLFHVQLGLSSFLRFNFLYHVCLNCILCFENCVN